MVGALGILAAETAGAPAHADVSWFVRSAWLVPLLPFLAAGLILFLGKRSPGGGAPWGIGAVGASFVLSLGVLWHVVQGGAAYEASIPWFAIGPLHVEAGILIDGLAAVMLVVVTSISLMVQVYSLGYMHADQRFTWFYVVLSLFTAAMLVVVVSNNVVQLLVGWEIMGVCSYLLIGHWWEEHENSSAAIKAFITTRIGDVPMIFGFFALIAATGFATANIRETTHAIAEGGEVSTAFLAIAALLLFGGTIGKSAQFPLHVWLPDAMAGPTPVSALIHAATMVAAGVYLVGRLFEVFVAADPAVLTTVSVVAAITMLGAALLAIAQDDIKRVLAYSTLSQLAYMVAGLSLGEEGFTAGFFHLFTHAFFKALLFLAAGSVIHAVHSNSMREMGGLRGSMPVTFRTMLIGALALAGVVPLAGFWSKDELLVVAYDTGTTWLFWLFLATAVVTALYTTRMIVLTFFGSYRGQGHPHESPPSMAGPLVALAAATAVVGFLGAPQLGAVFGKWVYVGHPHEAHVVPWIAVLSTAGALAGIAVGWLVYRDARGVDPLAARLGPLWRVLERRYYIDDLYMAAVVLPVRDRLSAAVVWVDRHVIDGAVNGAAWVTRGLARLVAWVDRHVVDGAVNGLGGLTGSSGGLLRYLQSGNVQWYAVMLFVGVIALTVVFIRIV
ncbi:MAG: NADH-quinone oxidoreductase subunit L [Actinomycetota bacterium]|nr:MAG: NADH-quinone oxidoreductase subunit L [Actinomycetota bacterium]